MGLTGEGSMTCIAAGISPQTVAKTVPLLRPA
jgi:hypothetical protein